MTDLVVFGLGALLIGLVAWIAARHGQSSAINDELRRDQEAIEEADRIRDRLKHDQEYADKVRDRFRRD